MTKRLTTQDFILKATKIHQGKYNYSEINYEVGSTILNLFCDIHMKYFKTTAENHTHNKGGCPTCRYEKSSKSMAGCVEKFISKSVSIYEDKFDYSAVKYKDAKTKVSITCREHNFTFTQTPDKHFSGNGCGKCVKNGYNKSKPGALYVLTCGDLTKIGITNRDVSLRAVSVSKSSGLNFNIALYIKFLMGEIPMRVETALLRELRSKYSSPTEVFDGSTECFVNVDYNSLISSIVSKSYFEIKE
jgi:hypothetical protein